MPSHNIINEEKNDNGDASGNYVAQVSCPASIPNAVQSISEGDTDERTE